MISDCIRFCFMDVIQEELDNIVKEWNTHKIRKNNGEVLSGIPDELYYITPAPSSGFIYSHKF